MEDRLSPEEIQNRLDQQPPEDDTELELDLDDDDDEPQLSPATLAEMQAVARQGPVKINMWGTLRKADQTLNIQIQGQDVHVVYNVYEDMDQRPPVFYVVSSKPCEALGSGRSLNSAVEQMQRSLVDFARELLRVGSRQP